MKNVWESKTVWLNLITALSVILALPELQKLLGADALVYVSLAQSVLNVILRLVTTQPVALSTQKEGK
jgi:hypothetical protein